MPTLTTDQPLTAAVEQFRTRVPVGSAMTSAEWGLAPAEIRLRSMFSSMVEDERVLAGIQERIGQRLELARSSRGVLMDRRRFIDEMRAELLAAGYKVDAKKSGGLQDLTSDRRLGLIWKMNIDQAQGYAEWLTSQTETALMMYPAMELVRLENRMEIREWPERWQALGGKFYPGVGPYPQGRMIALVNDPIWVKLNRFGVPWKPFDWGSGMGTRKIRRKEALALGVIQAKDKPQAAKPQPFNANAQASLKGIPAHRRRVIEDTFRGDVEIEGDVIRLLPPQSYSGMGRIRVSNASIPERITTPVPAMRPGTLLDSLKMPDVAITVGEKDLIPELERLAKLAGDVSGAGRLPDISVIIGQPGVLTKGPGFYKPVDSLRKEPSIWLNPRYDFWPMAWLHELAHPIDNMGLHTPGPNRIYASEHQPMLEPLMAVIRGSTASSRMAAMWGKNADAVTDSELFARAFAQYVADESGDPELSLILRKFRDGKWEDQNFPRHLVWAPYDFKIIRKVMRMMIAKAGWKGGDL